MKNHKTEKSLSILILVLCMLITLLPVPAYATEADEIEYEIPEDAIYISTAEELIELAENSRLNSWSVGKTVVLSNDIDVAGTDFTGIPTFGGTFLGDGHVVKGVSLTSEGSVVGFFRYLQETAIVDSLIIEGTVQPEGSKSVVGGLAGNNAGTIRNSVFKGTVTGYDQVGGLVGINETTGVIEVSKVEGAVYGSHFVGGIAGENHGVIRQSSNSAEINTKSVHNSVDVEDITIDSMISTESANTATDIGGIVGTNSGVLRECTNNGAIGYQSMGYNVGGIAGSQKGYIVDCVNQANIQGRKEVGGIVGHMEPNMVLEYKVDSFQILSEQLQDLSATLKEMRKDLESSNDKISQEMDALEKDLDVIQTSLDIIEEELNIEELENQESQETKESEWPDIEWPDSDLEDSKLMDIDWDRITAAMSDMSESMADAFEKISVIQETFNDTTSKLGKQLEVVFEQLDIILGTVEHMEDNLDFSIVDVSGEDTDADTLGKVSNCINYGSVTGELHVGGIAGVMADETDLDAYEDIEVVGDVSLNGTYRMRVVIRDCKNFGTISAGKQYVGGITGQMIIGAVLECINMGNLDAISADYVGGIAGDSVAIIRNSGVKCAIAGETYVGGIAGAGHDVENCYAFVALDAYTEKAGAILGDTEELPETIEEASIIGNYYFVDGKDIGGIDGISYEGAAEKKDVESFMQLPDMDELLRTVDVRFVVEGQEDVIITVNVGETLTMEDIPVLTVEDDSEYSWKIIPAVTSKILGMGETEEVVYISEEGLTNILFDQTYEAVFDLKATVIQTEKLDADSLATILAEGHFAKNTTVELMELILDENAIHGEKLLESWKLLFSNTGVNRLHYLIPSEVNSDFVKLYVQTTSGEWQEREFTVDESYIIFDFSDEETGFALVEDYSNLIQMTIYAGIVLGIIVVFVVVTLVIKAIRRKKK